MKIGNEARFCGRILHSLKILRHRAARVKFNAAVLRQSKFLIALAEAGLKSAQKR